MEILIKEMIGRRCCMSYKALEQDFKQKEGVITGESKDGRCWKILFDGRKCKSSYHKSFVAVIVGITK